ncbi:MAG: Flp family type IVb pilin [Candidatus Deferrimicrobiaceae bacterium]
MLHSLITMFRDEEGQGLVEYALIIVLVSIALIAALSALNVQLTNVFSQISSGLAGS